MDIALLRTLLRQSESETLDFKREQYRFYGQGADAPEKSELVKDILAFANAWRTSDAYILVGVEEHPGVAAEVVGVAQHLQDADVQQFLNSKANKPVRFLCEKVDVDGKEITVIRIDLSQERPLFLKTSYGRLAARAVYVRRGSSTAIADPDEVADMGRTRLDAPTVRPPVLEVALAIPSKRKSLGLEVGGTSIILQPPPEGLGRGGSGSDRFGSLMMHLDRLPDPQEVYRYKRDTARLMELGFWCRNTSPTTALDVRAVMTIPKVDGLLVIEEKDFPSRPVSSLDMLANLHVACSRDVRVDDDEGHWTVEAQLRKVQPSEETFAAGEFYVGATRDLEVSAPIKLYADNLPRPIEVIASISLRTETRLYRVPTSR